MSAAKPYLNAVILTASLIFLTCEGARAALPSARVDRIRHFSGPNYTRVVVELSAKVEYSAHLLKQDPSIQKPARLFIDVKNTMLGNIGAPIAINDGLLKMARAAQHDKDTVRVVLDIESIRDYKIFQLPNPYRIVIDVMGEGLKKVEAQTPVKKDGPWETPGHKKKTPAKTIVIDAGHGGKDPGAIGKKGLNEKDVTLKIAKFLRDELKGNTEAKIILTRDGDAFIPLDERTAIANSREADLFISIHVNASPKRSARGVETYYLGSTDDKDALRVASRENASSHEEMQDVLQYILKDLLKSGNQKESVRLASAVQASLASNLQENHDGIKNNGVKGALFYVLVNCNMPSILAEVSYISNPQEEKKLRSDKYLKDIAKGIALGVMKYGNGESVERVKR